jgi:hypothetical protein|nr:MAG TPA: hypothetical protein [Caudoviricetes sp.]
MKQTLEEAAKQGAEGYNIVGQVIYKSGFKAGAKWEKEQAIEILSSVLENWGHGGDANCIIAEFEEKINVQMVTN